MTVSTYSKVEKFVFDSFNAVGRPDEMEHFIRTVHWLQVLLPDADEALLVAAISHDIERAFRKKDVTDRKISLGFLDVNFLRPHEERGAKIISDFLKTLHIDDVFIARVKSLVSRHEEGGNDDQNILRDADSISFLEVNASPFIKNALAEVGSEKVKQKFDWMYDRIASLEAKRIARPFYKRAVQALNENGARSG